MEYFLLLPLCVVYGFAVCFASQIMLEENHAEKKIQYFIPQGKENIIMMIVVIFLLMLCSVILNYVYAVSLIENVKLISLLAVLCPAAYTDWNKHIIRNRLIIGAVCLRAVLFVIELILDFDNALSAGFSGLVAAVVIFVIGFLCSMVLKGSVGMGDVKLLAVMALFQGATGIVCSLFVSLLVAFFYCIAALCLKRKNKKDIIPFAPALLLGTYISVLLFGF